MEAPWYEKYVGKPWAARPEPPESFNCGELLRHTHLEKFGTETIGIRANALNLRECVENMRPEIFGLRPLAEGEKIKDFDCVFFGRASKYEDHCGLAANTPDGLLILHCLQNCGVVLESPAEAKARGFQRLIYYRHESLI